MHKGPTLKDRFILYPAIAAVFLFIFYIGALSAWGYKFSIEDGKIIRKETGIIIVATKPGSADVYLDGKKQRKNTPAFSFMSLTIKNIPVGNHRLQVVKDGYESWEGDRNVEPGLVSWANYLILVPQKRTASNYSFPGSVVQTLQSPDRSKLFVLVENSGLGLRTIWEVNLQNKERKKIKEEAMILGMKVAISSSAIDGNRLILVRSDNVSSKYFVIENRLDGTEWKINDMFGTSFNDLKFSGETNLELIALTGKDLRTVEYESKKMSAVLATGVISIFPERSGLFVIQNKEDNHSVIKVNSSGVENVIIKNIPISDSYVFDYLDKTGGYLLLPAKTGEVIYFRNDKNGRLISSVLGSKSLWYSVSSSEENVAIYGENNLLTYNFEREETYRTLSNKAINSMGWLNDESNIIYSDDSKVSLVNFDGFYDKYLFNNSTKTPVHTLSSSANMYFQTTGNGINDLSVYSFNF